MMPNYYMDINSILDVMLWGAISVVIFMVGLNLYKQYAIFRLNQTIIGMYTTIATCNRKEIEDIRRVLKKTEGIANPKYIAHAYFLLKLREEILNVKEEKNSN